MSEAAVAEPQVTPELSTASTPPPEETPAPVSEETAPPVTGEETPAATREPEPEPEPAPPSTPEERFAELDRKAEREGLTAAEAAEYKRLNQSITDRRQSEQQRLQAQRQRDQQRREAIGQVRQTVGADIATHLSAALEDGSPAALELANERIGKTLDTLFAYHESLHPVNLSLSDEILALYGDNATTRDWIERTSWAQKLEQLKQGWTEQAQRNLPNGAKVYTQAEITKLIKDAKQDAVDALKAANPGIEQPRVPNAPPPNAGPLTEEEAATLPLDELKRRRGRA